MKGKRILRIFTDVAMFALFLLLMEQHLLPEALHEWLGLSLFVLVLVHNALNYRWYAVLARGRYNALRAVQTADAFSYRGSNAAESGEAVDEWLSELGYMN